MEISLAVEGQTDEAVLRRVAVLAGVEIGRAYPARSREKLLSKLRAYAEAARHAPWLVVWDLDQSAACAPSFLRSLPETPTASFRLRIAVRSVESWLLADRDAFGAFFGVSVPRIPLQPELLDRPKETLLRLCRDSTHRHIREGVPPPTDSAATVGPGYVATLLEFVSAAWAPDRAAVRSPSLAGTIRAMASLRAPR